MTTHTRLTPADVGCWIDGHWGQYGIARSIELASEMGYDNPEALTIARKHLASIGPSLTDDVTDDEMEALYWYADEADDWLTTAVAPNRYSFGWHHGEWFMMDDEWWNEDD